MNKDTSVKWNAEKQIMKYLRRVIGIMNKERMRNVDLRDMTDNGIYRNKTIRLMTMSRT